MPARKLVANLRDAILTNTNLYKGVALAVSVLKDPVDIPELVITHRSRYITILLRASRNDHTRRHTERHNLTNEDVIRTDERILRHKAIRTKLAIIRILYMLCVQGIRLIKALFLATTLILSLLILVSSVEDRAKETALNRAAIDHDRILLIVARVGHDGDNDVLPRRHILYTIELAHVRGNHGNLRIAQQVRHGVEALLEVQGIHAHRLLPHCTLI